MMLRLKIIYLVVVSLTIGSLIAILLMYGWFDKFKEPIQIIVPRNVNGVLCFKSAQKSTHDIPSVQLKYQVQDNGFLEIDAGLLRGHRKVQFFRAASGTSPMLPISIDGWSPIKTENDAKSGNRYTVYWLGTDDEWMVFVKNHGEKLFCLEQ